MSKKHLSATQLSMYEMCAESYRRRYIEGEIIPPGIALLRGSGVHKGSAANFRQKIQSHEDMPKEDIVEVSVTAYEERIEEDGILLTEEEESKGKDNVIGAGKDEVVTLSELYADQLAPEYQPVMVEQKQRIELKGPYDLMAVMDMADDKDSVVDMKTASRKAKATDADISEQLSFYSLVFLADTGRMPKDVRLEVLVSKKVPERQCLISTRTEADLGKLIRRINTMTEGVSAGIFMPCNRNSWKCSERY